MAAAAAQWAVVMAVAAAATLAGGDMNADKTECADQLVGLAPCLQYVQGQARAPPPDCCGGLRQVLGKSPKCLCVLVKDKDDPNLGLKLNVTKALGLPAICKAAANISDCPSTWPPHHSSILVIIHRPVIGGVVLNCHLDHLSLSHFIRICYLFMRT